MNSSEDLKTNILPLIDQNNEYRFEKYDQQAIDNLMECLENDNQIEKYGDQEIIKHLNDEIYQRGNRDNFNKWDYYYKDHQNPTSYRQIYTHTIQPQGVLKGNYRRKGTNDRFKIKALVGNKSEFYRDRSVSTNFLSKLNSKSQSYNDLNLINKTNYLNPYNQQDDISKFTQTEQGIQCINDAIENEDQIIFVFENLPQEQIKEYDQNIENSSEKSDILKQSQDMYSSYIEQFSLNKKQQENGENNFEKQKIYMQGKNEKINKSTQQKQFGQLLQRIQNQEDQYQKYKIVSKYRYIQIQLFFLYQFYFIFFSLPQIRKNGKISYDFNDIFKKNIDHYREIRYNNMQNTLKNKQYESNMYKISNIINNFRQQTSQKFKDNKPNQSNYQTATNFLKNLQQKMQQRPKQLQKNPTIVKNQNDINIQQKDKKANLVNLESNNKNYVLPSYQQQIQGDKKLNVLYSSLVNKHQKNKSKILNNENIEKLTGQKQIYQGGIYVSLYNTYSLIVMRDTFQYIRLTYDDIYNSIFSRLDHNSLQVSNNSIQDDFKNNTNQPMVVQQAYIFYQTHKRMNSLN